MSNDKTGSTPETVEADLVLSKQSLAEVDGLSAANHPEYMDGDVVVKMFEKRSNLMRRIKAVAMKATNMADWVDFGKKPYLQATGAEKVRAELGLKLRIIGGGRRTETDEKGKYHIYSLTLEISHPALGGIEAVGIKSTRNKFFAIKTHWEGDQKVSVDVPQCDIKQEDVEKSAYSNALARAVTEFCGLRNLTWDEVNAALGKTDMQSQVTGVEFGSKGKPATPPSTSGKAMEDSPEKIAKAKDEIVETLMTINKGDAQAARDMMAKDVRTSDVNRLTTKQVFWYLKQLKNYKPTAGEGDPA
jgi:hypothetical protein